MPGRITAFAIDPTNSQILYAGAADGGVFKSVDGGSAWSTQWADQLSLTIGGLAVAPSRPTVVYAATGEWGPGQLGAPPAVTAPGVGVYRSDDAGNTWRLCAPITSEYTNAVAVHPTDPDVVFVAGDHALHRSRDGGISWDVGPANQIGVVDAEISDVVIDPSDPSHVLIGVHDSGVWESRNGGNSWLPLSGGLQVVTRPWAPRIAFADRDQGG